MAKLEDKRQQPALVGPCGQGGGPCGGLPDAVPGHS